MSRDHDGTESWDAAVASGLIRIAAGLALLRWPARFAGVAGARDGDRLATAVAAGFGARDLALGGSALAATRPGRDVRRQLRVQAAADVVDALIVATAVARGRLPRVRGIAGALIAVTSATGLAVTAGRLPPPR
jgi:hypothetical protein